MSEKKIEFLLSQKTLIRRTFNANMYATMIVSSDLQINTGNSIDADYEDLGENNAGRKGIEHSNGTSKATAYISRSSANDEKESAHESRRTSQTADYRELCEAIRKKIKCDFEGYRQKKLRTEDRSS
uniref:Uncharacterized protein n=1 Tax=Haemonchus contortus TaxID=6289 RepID=A0A7I4YIA9_HAECO